jgi:hypothetical protein
MKIWQSCLKRPRTNCLQIVLMSTVSLTPETKLNSLPKPKIYLDSRFKKPAEQFKDAKMLTDRLVEECNDLDAGIKNRIAYTERKIKRLEKIHTSSIAIWVIMGSSLAVMLGNQIFSGGRALWKWIKQKKQKSGTMESQDDKDKVSEERRLHSRHWKIAQQTRLDE